MISLTLAWTGKVEILAALAVNYIMEESSMISSHEQFTVLIYSVLNTMDDETNFGHRREIIDHDNYYLTLAVTEYMHHPQELGNTCLYGVYIY